MLNKHEDDELTRQVRSSKSLAKTILGKMNSSISSTFNHVFTGISSSLTVCFDQNGGLHLDGNHSSHMGRSGNKLKNTKSSGQNGKPVVCCNCAKSRCLKLYCECFANGQLCKGCNCQECLNFDEKLPERVKAINFVKERNPESFKIRKQDPVITDVSLIF